MKSKSKTSYSNLLHLLQPAYLLLFVLIYLLQCVSSIYKLNVFYMSFIYNNLHIQPHEVKNLLRICCASVANATDGKTSVAEMGYDNQLITNFATDKKTSVAHYNKLIY